MANELVLPKKATGLGTLYGVILGATDRGTKWNGSAFEAISGINDIDWANGLVSMAEMQTADTTATTAYAGDWPAGITAAGTYLVEVRSGNTPGAELLGLIEYTVGTAGSVTVGDITAAALAKFATEDTGETAAGDGSVAKLSQSAASGAIGSGAISWTITQKDDAGNPLDGVEVWITTDAAGSNVVAGTLCTDTAGQVTFMLDAGTYYVWRQLAGYDFTNPSTTTVA